MTSPSLAVRQQPGPLGDLAAAPWIAEWVDGPARFSRIGLLHRTISEGPEASLVSVRVPGALVLAAPEFERATREAYECIRSALRALRHCHPVRFWNYLPAIHEPMDSERDRYMVFNAGRFAALSAWFEGLEHFPGRLPAASGVGHGGDDLVIHCLALAQPGEAIENPRQIPAFRYSRRYGPKPPCFARATVVANPRDGAPLLFVAGTASIAGEQSVHQNDLSGQLEETFANLRALLGAAEGIPGPVPLEAFTHLRVYHLREDDAPAIEKIVRGAVGPSAQLQMVRADICRADLLVEIEGVARLRERSMP